MYIIYISIILPLLFIVQISALTDAVFPESFDVNSMLWERRGGALVMTAEKGNRLLSSVHILILWLHFTSSATCSANSYNSGDFLIFQDLF